MVIYEYKTSAPGASETWSQIGSQFVTLTANTPAPVSVSLGYPLGAGVSKTGRVVLKRMTSAIPPTWAEEDTNIGTFRGPTMPRPPM